MKRTRSPSVGSSRLACSAHAEEWEEVRSLVVERRVDDDDVASAEPVVDEVDGVGSPASLDVDALPSTSSTYCCRSCRCRFVKDLQAT